MTNTSAIDSFSPDQHMAVDMCADRTVRIASVTGEAGTGKTRVLGQSVTTVIDMGFTAMVCAPTGRAAARVKELTGHGAKTCHRLLGFGAPDPNDPDDITIPKRDSLDPIPYDFVFVDESSMLSEDLYRSLINAMKQGACIRFFGDVRQLPPVNSDDPPFKRLLERYPKVFLTKNYRSNDGIIQAAQTINRGSPPRANEKVKILNIGKQTGLTILDKFIDLDMLDPKKHQIICPTRVGRLGTDAVNAYVQQKINSTSRYLKLEYEDSGETRTTIVRPNDKILWTKNDYNLNLFNGMIGRIRDVDFLSGDLVVEFDGRDILVPSAMHRYDDVERESLTYDPRRYIDLAYAVTTHKSQGSEFDKIIIMLYYSTVLSRQNFYTAITRGRSQVLVIAAPGGLKAALKNDPVMEPKAKE